jgi:DNA polymerase elongation subunit (family B)
VNIKLDKTFSKLIYIAKKNYSGIIDGKLYSKGLDYIKSSTLKYAAFLQKDLLTKVLFDNQRSFQDLFEKYKQEFYSISWDESNIDQVTLMQRVTKHPSKYGTASTPAKVAQWMIDNGHLFYPGVFVPVIATGYVDGKMLGVHPANLEWKGKLDKDYIWAHQILPKLSRITEVISPQFDWKQFDPYIVEQRERKMKTYQKQLFDTQRNQHISKKIQDDVTLSELQKRDLLELASKSRAKALW